MWVWYHRRNIAVEEQKPKIKRRVSFLVLFWRSALLPFLQYIVCYPADSLLFFVPLFSSPLPLPRQHGVLSRARFYFTQHLWKSPFTCLPFFIQLFLT